MQNLMEIQLLFKYKLMDIFYFIKNIENDTSKIQLEIEIIK